MQKQEKKTHERQTSIPSHSIKLWGENTETASTIANIVESTLSSFIRKLRNFYLTAKFFFQKHDKRWKYH